MKKFIKLTLIFSLILINMFPMHAFAAEETPQWEDTQLSQEELAKIWESGTVLVFNEKATGLITDARIGISKSGTTLIIVGEISGITDVKKCGFKEVIVQKRTTANSDWVNIFTYEDLYADNVFHSIQKSLGVVAGYDYRVTCIFYAKKNIFSIQKIEATSNIVHI